MSARKQIVLRVDSKVNATIRAAAKRADKSINAYCEGVLGRSASKSASNAKR